MIESTCTAGFREMSLEETLRILERLGFKYYEGSAHLPCHLHPYLHGSRPVAELKDILAGSPLEMVAIAGNSDFAVNDHAWPEEAAFVRREIDFAVELGVDLLRIFVSHIPAEYVTEHVWRRALERMSEVVPYAEERGVRLALENHFGITGKTEDLLRVVENVQSPALGLLLDPANFVPCGQDPVQAAQELAPYVIYAHLKDCVPNDNGAYFGHDFVDVGAGVVDYPGVLKALKSSGYAGYLSVEYEEPPDVERGTADSLSRLREYMASLEAA
jgi:sugar phosphate isomerase/epimerase